MPNNNSALAALTISLSDCLTFMSFDLAQNNKLSTKQVKCSLYSVYSITSIALHVTNDVYHLVCLPKAHVSGCEFYVSYMMHHSSQRMADYHNARLSSRP